MTVAARHCITLSCKKATDVRAAQPSRGRASLRSLALLACVLGSAALDACINPCPRRQLMTYVAHTQGGLTKGVDVAARVDADDDWRVVGKVTAADATKLSRAAALQHRLIEEHARRLHKVLRTGPGGPPLELGIGDPITAVPTPQKRDFVAVSYTHLTLPTILLV